MVIILSRLAEFSDPMCVEAAMNEMCNEATPSIIMKESVWMKKTKRLFLMTGLVVTGISCAHNQRQPVAVAPPEPPPLYEWYGDELTGKAAIEIVLDHQKAYISIGGQDAGWTYLATGKAGYSTPTGKFKIIEKKVDKHSNLWGVIEDANGNIVDGDARNGREKVPRGGRFVGAPMPYWMRLTNSGIGMHVGPIPNPGMPASHGCIRLPRDLAIKLFDVVELGTPVLVIGRTPAAKRPQTPSAPGVENQTLASGTATESDADSDRLASNSTLR